MSNWENIFAKTRRSSQVSEKALAVSPPTEVEPVREISDRRFAIFTTQGKRPEQQDRMGIVQGPEAHPKRFGVVCLDGHGKLGGEVAETVLSIASRDISRLLAYDQLPTDQSTYNVLCAKWDLVAQQIESNDGASVSGTTLTFALVAEDGAFVGMLGDSEARVLHDASPEWVTKMTPHNPGKNIRDEQIIRRNGGTFSAKGYLHDEGGDPRLKLTRALGDRRVAHILKTPDCAQFSRTDGRWLVIGSDGLWNALSRRKKEDPAYYEDVLRLIQRAPSAEKASEILQNYLAPWNKLGDNCTFSVVDLQVSA